MSKSIASGPSTAAVHQWLERMEEENKLWDRKIADEPFDASQFLRDCISYRKRSSKYIAVKKRFWWLWKFFQLQQLRGRQWLVWPDWRGCSETLTTVALYFFGVLFDWVDVASRGDSHAPRYSSVVEKQPEPEVLRFCCLVFSLGPLFTVGQHSESSLDIVPSRTVALRVNQHCFL